MNVCFPGGYRGLIREGGDAVALVAALRDISDIWSRPGTTVLNEGRNRVGVVRVELASGRSVEVVVKEFSCRGVDRMKTLALPSKAKKAWEGALALEERGFATARPIGYLEKRRRGLVERCFFLAERLSSADEVRGLFRTLPPDELNDLLSDLAGELSRLHDRGILHRDLSDGNVLVRRPAGGRAAFVFLDTNRVRVRKRIGLLSRVKNLIRLGVPASFQKRFLAEYFRPRALPRVAWLWYKINKAVFAGYVGLKKTLRLRRIARRLGIQ